MAPYNKLMPHRTAAHVAHVQTEDHQSEGNGKSNAEGASAQMPRHNRPAQPTLLNWQGMRALATISDLRASPS